MRVLYVISPWVLHGSNALVTSSKSAVRHWCYKETNNRTSLWSHLTKSKSRFETSTSLSLCLLFSVCCMSLYLCLSEGWLVTLFVSLFCLCLCVSVPNKGLCSVFMEQHRGITLGKEWNTLQKSLTEFYNRLVNGSILFQLTQIANTIFFISRYSWMLHSTILVGFRRLLLASAFPAFSKWYTCTVLPQR